MSSDLVPDAKKDEVVSQEWFILRENHTFEYSMASLAAQERDRESERAHFRKNQNAWLRFIAGSGVFLLGLIIAAFFLDKEQFLLESLKLLAVGSGGGGVGYVFGYRRAKRE